MTERPSPGAPNRSLWGRGQRQFEMFLEPTCPFSVRAFGKIDETLAAAGQDNITIKIRLQSQPWHMYSGVIVRCVLAASTLPAGKEAAKAALAAVAAHREEFEFTKHCGGPNMDASPNQIIARLRRLLRIEVGRCLCHPEPGSRDQRAHQIRPAEWHPRVADLYDRWLGAA